MGYTIVSLVILLSIKEKKMYTYKAKLIRVIDGDTVDADIDLGFDIFVKQRIRLFGINTPQSRTNDVDEKERGLASKARLIELLPKEFIVETILNKRGKYGRVLGVITVVDDNGNTTNINETLIKEGYAIEHALNGKD